MPSGNVPNLPNVTDVAAQAIVRQVEKQNSEARDQGRREREAEAKRQQSQRKQQGTSGR